MKTLYININGEDIQGNADIHVVGHSEDALINAFYYELGNEILNGVPGVSKISKRDLVLEFKTHNKDRFDKILDQWTALKKIVLGANPSGQFGVELPDEYVKWLQDKSDRVYRAIAMSLVNRGRKVNISIDNIYEAIELLIDSIEPDDCSDCEQFVVNDELVIGQSRLVRDIKNKYGEELAFVQFCNFDQKETINPDGKRKIKDDSSSKSPALFAVGISDGGAQVFGFKNNFRFALFDEHGDKKSDFIYRRVDGHDAFCNGHSFVCRYDNNGHKINIECNPLFAKNEIDSKLYLITSSGPVEVCDYKDGQLNDEPFLSQLSAKVRLKVNFPLIQVERLSENGTVIHYVYLYENGSFKNIYQSKSYLDITSSSVDLLLSKFNIPYEYHEGVAIDKKTGERILFPSFECSMYIGTSKKWGDLFLANHRNAYTSKGCPVFTKDGQCVYYFDFFKIFELSSDGKYIVTTSKKGDKFGLMSVEGEVLLPVQYNEIKEIRTGIYLINGGLKYYYFDYFFIPEAKLRCAELFDDFYLVIKKYDYSLISRKTNIIILERCGGVREIDKGLYQVFMTNDGEKSVVMDHEGNVVLPNSKSYQLFGNGYYKIDDIIIDRTGKKYSENELPLTQKPSIWYNGSKKFGYSLGYTKNGVSKTIYQIKGRIEDAQFFSDELIWIKTRNDGECLIDIDGNIIFDLRELYSYKKLSDSFFVAFESTTQKKCIYNMDTRTVIIEPKYDDIAYIGLS